jgi:hypothetical protein
MEKLISWSNILHLISTYVILDISLIAKLRKFSNLKFKIF